MSRADAAAGNLRLFGTITLLEVFDSLSVNAGSSRSTFKLFKLTQVHVVMYLICIFLLFLGEKPLENNPG